MPAFSDRGYRVGDFAIAEKACARSLSVPVHPALDEASVREIASAIREILTA